MLKYIASYIVGIALVVSGIFAGTTVASAQSVSTTYACQYIWGPPFSTLISPVSVGLNLLVLGTVGWCDDYFVWVS